MNATSFVELGLSPEILRAVSESGYTIPTPIQVQAIPVVLAGRDVMGGAQTGTGKTAGFGLPILHRLQPQANTSPSPARHPVRALILAPTRELAIQVEEAIKEYGKYTGLRSTCVFGGVDIRQQLPIVRAGVEILVATPGRLLDHIEQKSLNLSQVEIFVLDEADRMLDMGFIPDIKRIMALLPAASKRQNLLFSATFSGDIKKLADQLLNQPQLIEVARRNTAAETVTQSVYRCPQDAKRALLTHIVRSRKLRQVLCFVRTKHGASRLARQLEKDGLETSAIHGDKTQGARMDALAAFKEGKLEVLVATDVAARGLDVDDLPLVVNYELPHVPEDYIHRIGRTGRAGAIGEAISLVAPEEEKYLTEIERLLKIKVNVCTADGFDPATAGARSPSPRARSATAPRADGHSTRSPRTTRVEAHAVPAAPEHARSPRTALPRSTREIEREEAYARNPDQPLPTGAERSHALGGHGHRDGKSRPVPALLMKRKSPEPQSA
ncbi:MAG: DEAD/DEAH box helicase [Burkholderiales bacterium]|nr:DEAD/DEAH box helicase [Burkholderiales bacterium]